MMKLQGKVAWILGKRSAMTEGSALVGIEFSDVPEKTLALLNDHIARQFASCT